MKIGITCYPTVGGSGIVASTLGQLLAKKGFEVHFISYGEPYRLPEYHENIYYHEVEISDYPLFKHPPYSLTLTSKMVEVVQEYHLDILHVHYAIPHAISAYLAKEILNQHVKIITTLHGTDITLVGQEKSFFSVVQFALKKSDGITAVSHYLKEETLQIFGITSPSIEVIQNCVDTQIFRPNIPQCSKYQSTHKPFCKKEESLFIHVSNFRPVKHILDVIEVFDRVRQKIPAHLIMVGEGPDLPAAREFVQKKKIRDQVTFVGNQQQVEVLLALSDIFLLTSRFESFGLAALEAMSCGVPVLAARGGGIVEVIDQGETGFLCEPGNYEEMANYALKIIQEPGCLQRMKQQCRESVLKKFHEEIIVEQYIHYYQKIMNLP
ncbi:MAG: N-acetyl-alpha-D-glucosaminyl L-malate synthase BshA [Planctomycetota bacterium]